MSMRMAIDPVSNLALPSHFVDEKQSLKRILNEWLDETVMQFQHLKGRYFITLHAKFDPLDPETFTIDSPKVTKDLPPFLSNSFVWYVNNQSSVCELLWMVPPRKKGEKLKVEFNKSGVAYLQAKGAMPKPS